MVEHSVNTLNNVSPFLVWYASSLWMVQTLLHLLAQTIVDKELPIATLLGNASSKIILAVTFLSSIMSLSIFKLFLNSIITLSTVLVHETCLYT